MADLRLMAYPAVNSLIQTLKLFQTRFPVLIHDQISSLFSSAEYFQTILENTTLQKQDFENIKELVEEIIAAVHQAEDLLESIISETMRARYSQGQGVQVLLQDVPPLIHKIGALRNDMEEFVGHGHATSTTSAYGSGDSSFPNRASTALLQDATVGLDDAFAEVRDRLLISAPERKVIPILGMGGCGKTTLARKAHSDPSITSHFEKQGWVTISQEYHLQGVLVSLVSCITADKCEDMRDDQLIVKSHQVLLGRRYLIVIDDIWSTEIWDLISRALPDGNNGSRIILTTRLADVAKYVNPDTPPLEIKPLSSCESFNLFCDKLFGAENNCPSELEKIGKKIVRKCRGLPLAILVFAGHLSKVPMTRDSWAAVAKNVREVVASDPDQCQAVLAMSYHQLPVHLKPCFLHMGIFPEDKEIHIPTLIRFWVAERFLKWDRRKTPEEVAEYCLEELISRNLIMVGRRKSNDKIKSCVIHDLLRDLSVTEAQRCMFLGLIKWRQCTFPRRGTGYSKRSARDGIRRFYYHSPIFMLNSSVCDGITRVSSVSSFDFETLSKSLQVRMRSLYITDGVPISSKLHFKALRVFCDCMHFSGTWCNWSYPSKLFNPAFLRYLEVSIYTKNINLESIAIMYNLETVIFYPAWSYKQLDLPRQIWNMKQLKHLRARCFYFPNPPRTDGEDSSCDLGLQNLEELSGVWLASCTKEVFDGLPNLRKLKIYDTEEENEDISRNLLNLAYLNKLEKLSCLFPPHKWFHCPPTDCFSFPRSLKKFSLSGSSFRWNDSMGILAKLPNLQVLKLRYKAITGSKLKLNADDQFNQLTFLMLDFLCLEEWEADSVNFPNLRRLVLQDMHCQIPPGIGDICTLESIELYRCDSTARESAKEIQEEASAMAGTDQCFDVRIYDDLYDLRGASQKYLC